MNMAKLGTVSRAGNYFHSLGKWLKQRAGGFMRYTLCELNGMPSYCLSGGAWPIVKSS